MEPVVAREVAEADFERFCNRHDLRVQPSKFSPDAVEMWREQKDIIIEEMMAGRLIVTDDGMINFQAYSSGFKNPTLCFKELSYEFLEETDKYAKEGIHKRNRMLLAHLTGRVATAAEFYHMGKRDYHVCTAILVIIQGESRPL